MKMMPPPVNAASSAGETPAVGQPPPEETAANGPQPEYAHDQPRLCNAIPHRSRHKIDGHERKDHRPAAVHEHHVLSSRVARDNPLYACL